MEVPKNSNKSSIIFKKKPKQVVLKNDFTTSVYASLFTKRGRIPFFVEKLYS